MNTQRACTLSLIAALTLQTEICSIERVHTLSAFNAEAQWIVQTGSNTALENTRPFFDAGITGLDQVVALSDSGLDTDNCYFWDKTGDIQKDGTVDHSRRKVVQYVPYADDMADYGSHGTHTAGTIIGRRALDGLTETTGRADGIARDAKVAFFDIGPVNAMFLQTPEDHADLFDPGMDAGAKIHSASWGSDYNGYGWEEREFDKYAFEHDDFLIVVAAGNTGNSPFRIDIANSVGAPATAKNVLAVGASHSEGGGLSNGMLGKDYIADFSSRGPTQDGRMKPEVVAPGYFILSANARPDREGECDGSNGVKKEAGSSMSAPVVSGTAALLRQYFMEGWYPSGTRQVNDAMSNPSASLIKAVLINGAQNMRGVQNTRSITQVRPYDNHQGFGRVSMIDALPLRPENSLLMMVQDRRTIVDGDRHTYDIYMDHTIDGCDADLSITLVWTDPPALPNCRRCLLNDLDLSVTTTDDNNDNNDEVVLFPNGKSQKDDLNNAERIQISSKNNNNHGHHYVVHVHAADLTTSAQNYALVVTGCFSEDPNTKTTTTSPNASSSTTSPNVTPVVTTPSPTPRSISSSNTKTISTIFNGGFMQAGNMFNIRAEKNILIKSIDIHTASTDMVQVQVYTRMGSYRNNEFYSWGWTKVVNNASIKGMGSGNPTPVPEELFQRPIAVVQGAIQGFYITLTTSPDLIYTMGTMDGAVFSYNDDISIGEGAAKTGLFGVSYKPRVWNGSFHYELVV